MEVKHAPLPWVATGRYIGTPNHMSYVGEVRDENGNWSDTAKSRGDAAFIVRACNSHYELIEALKNIQAAQNTSHGCMATILNDISKIASDAIAKAEGRS